MAPDELAAYKTENMIDEQRAAYDAGFRGKSHFKKLVAGTPRHHERIKSAWRGYTLSQRAVLADDASALRCANIDEFKGFALWFVPCVRGGVQGANYLAMSFTTKARGKVEATTSDANAMVRAALSDVAQWHTLHGKGKEGLNKCLRYGNIRVYWVLDLLDVGVLRAEVFDSETSPWSISPTKASSYAQACPHFKKLALRAGFHYAEADLEAPVMSTATQRAEVNRHLELVTLRAEYEKLFPFGRGCEAARMRLATRARQLGRQALAIIRRDWFTSSTSRWLEEPDDAEAAGDDGQDESDNDSDTILPDVALADAPIDDSLWAKFMGLCMTLWANIDCGEISRSPHDVAPPGSEYYPGLEPTPDNRCPVCSTPLKGVTNRPVHIMMCIVIRRTQALQQAFRAQGETSPGAKCVWKGCRKAQKLTFTDSEALAADIETTHIVNQQNPIRASAELCEKQCGWQNGNASQYSFRAGSEREDWRAHFPEAHGIIHLRKPFAQHRMSTRRLIESPDGDRAELRDALETEHEEEHGRLRPTTAIDPKNAQVPHTVEIQRLGRLGQLSKHVRRHLNELDPTATITCPSESCKKVLDSPSAIHEHLVRIHLVLVHGAVAPPASSRKLKVQVNKQAWQRRAGTCGTYGFPPDLVPKGSDCLYLVDLSRLVQGLSRTTSRDREISLHGLLRRVHRYPQSSSRRLQGFKIQADVYFEDGEQEIMNFADLVKSDSPRAPEPDRPAHVGVPYTCADCSLVFKDLEYHRNVFPNTIAVARRTDGKPCPENRFYELKEDASRTRHKLKWSDEPVLHLKSQRKAPSTASTSTSSAEKRKKRTKVTPMVPASASEHRSLNPPLSHHIRDLRQLQCRCTRPRTSLLRTIHAAYHELEMPPPVSESPNYLATQGSSSRFNDMPATPFSSSLSLSAGSTSQSPETPISSLAAGLSPSTPHDRASTSLHTPHTSLFNLSKSSSSNFDLGTALYGACVSNMRFVCLMPVDRNSSLVRRSGRHNPLMPSGLTGSIAIPCPPSPLSSKPRAPKGSRGCLAVLTAPHDESSRDVASCSPSSSTPSLPVCVVPSLESQTHEPVTSILKDDAAYLARFRALATMTFHSADALLTVCATFNETNKSSEFDQTNMKDVDYREFQRALDDVPNRRSAQAIALLLSEMTSRGWILLKDVGKYKSAMNNRWKHLSK
ncbi:hypothetical protein PENSPDRAFT_684261 [Peniophora sp. CONT]|nr:hypothetical protein PENSPDRAFT_684261 [Peniophora sp. CONT]